MVAACLLTRRRSPFLYNTADRFVWALIIQAIWLKESIYPRLYNESASRTLRLIKICSVIALTLDNPGLIAWPRFLEIKRKGRVVSSRYHFRGGSHSYAINSGGSRNFKNRGAWSWRGRILGVWDLFWCPLHTYLMFCSESRELSTYSKHCMMDTIEVYAFYTVKIYN